MIMLEATAIGIQIVLPLALIGWMAFAPLKSRVGFSLQALLTFCALLALTLVPLWTIPPWWTPFGYLALWTLAAVRHAPLIGRADQIWPSGVSQYVGLVILLPLGAWSVDQTYQAFIGRTPPPEAVLVDLPLPLGPGTYLIANGGATSTVNGHFLTLDPKTDRQRAYRGQSYAVDLVKVNGWGMRAFGWRPRNPTTYLIFGEPVFAPCEGTVISANNDLPDMPVPVPDETLLEGNHVVLDCGDYLILLAHLKQGSVLVKVGDEVRRDQPLGKVGNSGKTFEPHLHLHVQRPAAAGQPLLSGEPLHIAIDGNFLVRNERVRVDYPRSH